MSVTVRMGTRVRKIGREGGREGGRESERERGREFNLVKETANRICNKTSSR